MTDAELDAYERDAVGSCSQCGPLVAEVRRLAGERERLHALLRGWQREVDCKNSHGESMTLFALTRAELTPDGSVR